MVLLPVVEPNTNPGRRLEPAVMVVGGVGGMVVGIGMEVVLIVSIIVVDSVVVVVDVFSRLLDSMSKTFFQNFSSLALTVCDL